MENTQPPAPPPLKLLSPQEWETLIDDHQYGGSSRRQRWISSNYTGLPLIDLSLSSIIHRKDLPLNIKLHLIVFLEEHLVTSPKSDEETEQILVRLLDALRSLINSPNDGVSVTYSLKEQLLVSATSTFILFAINTDDHKNPSLKYTIQLEGLIELLLTLVNRPNHSVDRQLRGVACECLRELERECPGLLSETAGNLWGLCQSEKTHVGQSYVLLLANVIHGIVISKVNVSILTTSIPLVPFNVPQFLIGNGSGKENLGSGIKELRRVMSFLLEWPPYLNSFGLFEFMSIITQLGVPLELQASLLKVQFSGLLYTYDMLLCHGFLKMYLAFPDAFSGQENEVVSRLLLISRETQHPLVFRLIALHWLLGFMGLVMLKRKVVKEKIFETGLQFYPTVFDPLALKALKLELLAYCSILLDMSRLADANGTTGLDVDKSVVKLFEDGLESVSSFKWLPPWSTETAVAFRAFHKFLIGASSHSNTDFSSTRALMESTIFQASKRMLVNMTLESQGLILVMEAFIGRLLGCEKHRCLGERLLQTFNELLLPKVKIDYQLGSYFPLFEKIAENDTVPPSGLLELLGKFMIILVEKHGPDTGLRSWSQGSKVLGLCRTMLMHHHSSQLFLGLSRLLAFTCLYFPDLEVRDNARIYLRMLISVPGKKLRHLLNSRNQPPGISSASHSSSFFSVQSPRLSQDFKKSRNVSSYIHLERVVPLLVKQSWSLSLISLGIGDKPGYLEVIKDSENPSWQMELDSVMDIPIVPDNEGTKQSQEPLRVTDSKISEIVGILRRHYSAIPDFRYMSGLKIGISCSLSFQSEPFNRVWGVDSLAYGSPGVDIVPALYATVLKFSSSAPYGSIQPYRIPFLLGVPTKNDFPSGQTDSLDIVPVGDHSIEEEENFKAPVLIEFEPREPTPGLIDVSIETNAESGQIICGHLQSITVGIEDMFLQAIVPETVHEDSLPNYYVDLFNALWEACGSSSSTGRETFPLKGGKGVAAINGTRSVKFLEVPATSLIQAVERNLAVFVVSVVGDPLVNIVKDGGIIKDVIWSDAASDSAVDVISSDSNIVEGPLYLKYVDMEEEDDRGTNLHLNKTNMGCFRILIFLPPRFHILFQMEVGVSSTLVRIRTDHWPCLAYVDEYLEALFLA